MRYDVRAGVAWLRIDRPDALNALDHGVRRGLWDGFRRFDRDDDARVALEHVLHPGGAGRPWCPLGRAAAADTTSTQPTVQRTPERRARNSPLALAAAKQTFEDALRPDVGELWQQASSAWEPVYTHSKHDTVRRARELG